jgi:hypothetical protein
MWRFATPGYVLLWACLSLAQLLDREAACAVQGGIDAFPIEPEGGTGGAPVSLPWPLPAFPLPPG